MFAFIIFYLISLPHYQWANLKLINLRQSKSYILLTQLCFTYVLVNMIKKCITKILSGNKPKYFCRVNLRQSEIFLQVWLNILKNEKKITLTQTFFVVLSKWTNVSNMYMYIYVFCIWKWCTSDIITIWKEDFIWKWCLCNVWTALSDTARNGDHRLGGRASGGSGEMVGWFTQAADGTPSGWEWWSW